MTNQLKALKDKKASQKQLNSLFKLYRKLDNIYSKTENTIGWFFDSRYEKLSKLKYELEKLMHENDKQGQIYNEDNKSINDRNLANGENLRRQNSSDSDEINPQKTVRTIGDQENSRSLLEDRNNRKRKHREQFLFDPENNKPEENDISIHEENYIPPSMIRLDKKNDKEENHEDDISIPESNAILSSLQESLKPQKTPFQKDKEDKELKNYLTDVNGNEFDLRRQAINQTEPLSFTESILRFFGCI